MQQRQLTYSIPLAKLNRNPRIQAFISEQAVNLNGQCDITFMSRHVHNNVLSLMVLTMVVSVEHCDYVHRNMQQIIAEAMERFSPTTDTVEVADTPVTTRDFNCEDI